MSTGQVENLGLGEDRREDLQEVLRREDTGTHPQGGQGAEQKTLPQRLPAHWADYHWLSAQKPLPEEAAWY